MSVIEILKSSVTSSNNLVRVNTEIIDDGQPYTLFVEVEEEYKEYLVPELADNILYMLLPYAMRFGHDIKSHIPVTEMFLHNINEILIPHLVMGDKTLHTTTITTPPQQCNKHYI